MRLNKPSSISQTFQVQKQSLKTCVIVHTLVVGIDPDATLCLNICYSATGRRERQERPAHGKTSKTPHAVHMCGDLTLLFTEKTL